MAATVDTAIDNTYEDVKNRVPLVLGGLDYEGVTDAVAGIWEAQRPPRIWYVILVIAIALLGMRERRRPVAEVPHVRAVAGHETGTGTETRPSRVWRY